MHPSNLQDRIEQLRRRARHAIWLYGLSWVLVLVMGAAFGFGLLDWLLHINVDALRMAVTLCVIAATGVLAWRVLIQPLRQELSDVALALKIEQRYPGLHDSLASTVQFSEGQRNPGVGSPELQQLVIHETESRIRHLDFSNVVQTRDVGLASTAAIGVCLLVAVVAGLRPVEASLALKRFVVPFSAADWPRKTHLRLLTSDLHPVPLNNDEPFPRVHGDTLTFYVDNITGPLPDDLRLRLTYGDGNSTTETLDRQPVNDAQGRRRKFAVVRILAERGPIRFRVVGGDDHTMPMQTINVVPAPRLESLHVTLQPPEYSRRPLRKLPEDIGHFEAHVGTNVTVRAVANKPLKSALLRMKSDPPQRLSLSADGKRFTAEFLLRDNGNYSYWFELTDRRGFTNPNAPRYDIQARVDRLPVVRLSAPAEDLTATPGATIPVKATVEDDLAVRGVALRYRSSTEPKTVSHSVPLYQAPERSADDDPSETPDRAGDEVSVSHQWQLPEAAVGLQFRMTVQATDFYNLNTQAEADPTDRSQHVGESQTRIVTLVSPEDKAAEIARNYDDLIEQLKKIETSQRETHEQITQLQLQLDKAGHLREDRDFILFKRAADEQRDIIKRLVESRQSVEQRTRRLLNQLRLNNLDKPVLTRRLKLIQHELEALRTTALQALLSELRQLETLLEDQVAQGTDDDPESAQRQLRHIGTIADHQQLVLRSLRDLISELSEWRNWQELKNELNDLTDAQKSLRQDVEQLKRETLGKSFSELTDQQKADLARLGERQRRIADRLNRFQQSVKRFLDTLRKNPEQNRTAIETLSDVNRWLRDNALPQRMQNASGRIEANHLGQSAAEQKKLVDALDELQAVLENRPFEDLETLIKKQKQAEDELLNLHKQQQDLADRLNKLGKNPSNKDDRRELQRLIKRQEELRRKTAEMARRLRRLSANNANQSLQRAGNGMNRSLEALRRQAVKQGRIEQQDVLDNLQQARRQLARTRQRMKTVLAREVLEQLADVIQGLIDRQHNVVEGTSRLYNEYEQAGKWSRGRLITLDTLRNEQTRLQSRIAELADSTKSAAVLSHAFARIGHSMQQADTALGRGRDEAKQLLTAVGHQRGAKRQMERLLKTLQPERNRSEQTPPQTGDGKGTTPSDLSGPSVMAQLKLLKALQEQLAEQVAQWDGNRQAGKELSQQQQDAVQQFAERQAELADLTAQLMRELGISPTENVPEPDNKSDSDSDSDTDSDFDFDTDTDADTDTENDTENDTDADTDDAQDDRRDKPEAETAKLLLKRVLGNMRRIAERLEQQDAGETTQQKLQTVIDDLDKLLRAARQNAPSNSDNPPQPKQQQKQKSAGKQSGKKPATGQQPAKKKSSADGNGKSPSKNKPAKNKRDKTDPGVRKTSPEQLRKMQIAKRQRLVEEVWGHLPEHVKQRLRNIPNEKYLPKYKSLINKYFEALADEPQTQD